MVISGLSEDRARAFRRLCEDGAIGATKALATFLGAADGSIDVTQRVVHQPVQLVPQSSEALCCVAFELSGQVTGGLLLILPHDAAQAIAARLLGADDASTIQLDDDRVRAALSEVGNIVASAFLNAISQTVGAPCLPSVPELLSGNGEVPIADALARIEAPISEIGGQRLDVTLQSGTVAVEYGLCMIPTADGLDHMVARGSNQPPASP